MIRMEYELVGLRHKETENGVSGGQVTNSLGGVTIFKV